MGKPKKNPYPTPAHAEADRLLREYGAAHQAKLAADAAMLQEFDRLKASSSFWGGLQDACDQALDQEHEALKALKEFEAQCKQDLFSPSGQPPEEIKTALPHGDLIYSLQYAVAKPRKIDVLANIEEYALLEIYGLGDYSGFVEAIKVTKSVNWEVLKNWPQERLIAVGTEKKPKEIFTFDLREEP